MSKAKALTHPCRRLGIDPRGSGMNYRPTSYENCLSWSILTRNFEFCSKCDSPWKICFTCARKGGRSAYKEIQRWILEIKSEISQNGEGVGRKISGTLFLGINRENLCCFHAGIPKEDPPDPKKQINHSRPLPCSKEEVAAVLFPEEFQAPAKIIVPSFGSLTEKTRHYSSFPKNNGVGRTVSLQELEEIRRERDESEAAAWVSRKRNLGLKKTECAAGPKPAPKSETVSAPNSSPEKRDFLFPDLISEIIEKIPEAADSSKRGEKSFVRDICLEFPLNGFGAQLCLFFIRLDGNIKKLLRKFTATQSDEALTFLSFCQPLFDLSPASFEALLKKIAGQNSPLSQEEAKQLILQERARIKNELPKRAQTQPSKETKPEITVESPESNERPIPIYPEPAIEKPKRSSGKRGKKRISEEEILRREEAKKARKQERERQKREDLQKLEKVKEERKKQLAVEKEERERKKEEAAKLVQARKQERELKKQKEKDQKDQQRQKRKQEKIQERKKKNESARIKKQQKEAKKKLIVLEAANAIADSAVRRIRDLEKEKLRLIFFGNGSAPEESAKIISELRIAAEKIIELLEQNI